MSSTRKRTKSNDGTPRTDEDRKKSTKKAAEIIAQDKQNFLNTLQGGRYAFLISKDDFCKVEIMPGQTPLGSVGDLRSGIPSYLQFLFHKDHDHPATHSSFDVIDDFVNFFHSKPHNRYDFSDLTGVSDARVNNQVSALGITVFERQIIDLNDPQVLAEFERTAHQKQLHPFTDVTINQTEQFAVPHVNL